MPCGKLPRVKKVRRLHSFFTEIIFLLFSSTLLQCSKKKAVLVWSKLVVVFMSKGEAVPAVQIIATLTLAAAPRGLLLMWRSGRMSFPPGGKWGWCEDFGFSF